MKKGIHLRLDEKVLNELKKRAEYEGLYVQELLRSRISDWLTEPIFVDDGKHWSPKTKE